MAENVIVRQNSDFGIIFLATDPETPEDDQLYLVEDIRALSPYGMLLASLGSCTTIVLHTYAQNHGIALDEVELRLTYDRSFDEDCEDCESKNEFTESIEQEVFFAGELEPREQERLLRISEQCSIHHILRRGITINSRAGVGDLLDIEIEDDEEHDHDHEHEH